MQIFAIRKMLPIAFIGYWHIVGAVENAYRNIRRFGQVAKLLADGAGWKGGRVV